MYPLQDSIIINKVHIYYPQVGSNDCGLFALAYIKSICELQEPSLIKYDQNKLRENYNNFVTSGKLEFDIIESHLNCLRNYTRYSIPLN